MEAVVPTVLRRDGFRFSFFSDEGNPREPPHVHVSGGGNEAKIWLEPEVAVAESYGFNARIEPSAPNSTRGVRPLIEGLA
jgi:hypothetical protein